MSAVFTRYRFGDFELNPAESSLTRSGTTVPITPKALHLLSLLVQNQGHVLDKSYLLSQIWQDSFVEDGNLTFNIRQLRKILHDEVKSPKFIETVPKRGYRFVGRVERLVDHVQPANIAESTAASSSPVSQPKRRSSWSPWLLAIPVILAAGGVAAVESWFGIIGRDAKSPKLLSTPFSLERLSSDGDVFHAALSKSGDFVVYVYGNPNQKQSVRVRDLSTGQSREVLEASDNAYLGIDISNDGSTVYFVRILAKSPEKACIFRMNLIGGIPESLGCGLEGWFDLSNDGKFISFVRCTQGPERLCSLYISDENLKKERLLVSRKRPNRITDNAISPDGKSVVFTAGQTIDGSQDFGIYRFDLETGNESAVVDEKFFNVIGIDWMPDGDSLLATALRPNDSGIYFWKIDLKTRTASRLRDDDEAYKAVSIDAAGSKLVSTVRTGDFRVYVYSIETPAGPTDLGRGWTPRFAPDGRIMFASDRSGNSAIWSANVDGKELRHLSFGYDEFPLSSPDGSTVYFSSRRSGKIDVWSMRPDGSEAKQLAQNEGGFPIGVSPDGAWIYYLSALKRNLRKVSRDGTFEQQVSSEALKGAVISPDDAVAAYIDNNQKSVKFLSLSDTSAPKQISVPDGQIVRHLAWPGQTGHIYAILYDASARSNSVWKLAIDGSSSLKISDLNVRELGERSSFSVSPDERYLAVGMGEWKHDAVLIRGLK